VPCFFDVFGRTSKMRWGIRRNLFLALRDCPGRPRNVHPVPTRIVPMAVHRERSAGSGRVLVAVSARPRAHADHLPIYITTVRASRLVMLGYWALLQLLSGWASLRQIGQGGVAFFAHVGGFIAGSS